MKNTINFFTREQLRIRASKPARTRRIQKARPRN